MHRRSFITLLSGAAMSPLAVRRHANAEQAPGKLPKVGVLLGIRSENSDALAEGLRRAGYIDGQNITYEMRFLGSSLNKTDEAAKELVTLKCNLILAANPYAIQAARQATDTIPIIGIDLESDPVAAGWAQSLARPGGNFTGVFLDIPELGGKLVEFARELVPTISRVAILWDETIGGTQFRATQAAAKAAGLTLDSLPIRDVEEIMMGLKAASEQTQCVVMLSSPIFFQQRSVIADFALQKRLPTISLFTSFPKVGGLMAYGPNVPSMFSRAASYTDKVLSGAKVGDLPIERPSKFELVINLRTAKTLGITVPESLLGRANEVIE